jgi:hypothetical protein
LNSSGVVVSIDIPYRIWGEFILGAEVGYMKEINVIEKYKTLDELSELERELKQSNTFFNIKATKYFDASLFPYVGIGFGISGSKFVKKPILFTGINLKSFSKYPLNLNLEIRTVNLNLHRETVEFNNYGNSEVSTIEVTSNGLGLLASLIYVF